MTDNIGYISYHGKSSADFGFGINIDSKRVHSAANLTFNQIPSSSIENIFSNAHSRSPTDVSFSCTIDRPERFEDMDDLEDAVMDWLDGSEYAPLRLSWKPTYIYMAIVSTAPDFTQSQDDMESHEIATITFHMQPLKYRADGYYWQSLPKNGQIVNPERLDAYPDWHFKGTGNFVLTVNGMPYQFNNIDGDCYLDGLSADCFQDQATSLNENVVLTNNDAPVFEHGLNTIKFEPQTDASLDLIEWKPNWRRIL